MLAACLCCRKKIPKNEFWGQEGMVKIKNHEDSVLNVDETYLPAIDGNSSSQGGDSDSKRASNAPHRSLPDIPVTESLNDNVSELYATVADKIQQKPQGRSPTPSLKKQTSVSQHSSISQADDISSPYARVKTPPHEYDNVLSTEHPYAQVNAAGPSTSAATQQQSPNFDSSPNISTSRRSSRESLLGPLENQQEIPAASAIAGMISASQELPYMTPPIVPQPHFSGDSQDSSKGYTSISVREPLANILAQTKRSAPARVNRKDDSHYATVSDDSDEMYAAIEDPKINQVDIYTSGSETYAQIQPSNAITVSVEINTTQQQTSRVSVNPEPSRSNATTKKAGDTPVPPPVDTLKAQMHSRQASSSSNTSSVGNIGSPKPEKRQANSPLPPTPKNLQHASNSNLTSTSSIPSGRNSVASVIEAQLASGTRITSKENISQDIDDDSSGKKDSSPFKDIEGMYAKVIKKNRHSNSPSQNASPVLNRKSPSDAPPDHNQQDFNLTDLVLNSVQGSPDKRRPKSTSGYETKDHGYETIPAGKMNCANGDVNGANGITNTNNAAVNRKSDGYAQVARRKLLQNEIDTPGPILTTSYMNASSEIFGKIDPIKIASEPGYESLPGQSSHTNDPGYETLTKADDVAGSKKSNSDYDPNYEVLRPPHYENSDDGYAKVFEKCVRIEDDASDGYSRVKEACDLVPGYSSIREKKSERGNHDYASIGEDKKLILVNNNNNTNDDTGSEIYASIHNEQPSHGSPDYHNYQTISETKSSLTATNNSSCTSTSNLADKLKTPSTGQNSPEAQMRCSSTSNTISSSQQHSSNYGSLTGSESDPNYESVRYVDSENPYERLVTDPSISPDVTLPNISTETSNQTPSTSSQLQAPFPLASHLQNATATNSIGSSENGEVDDYFQV